MAKVIELLARLVGDNDEFVKAIKDAGKTLDGFMDGVGETAKAVQDMATKIATAAAGVGVAVGGGLVAAAVGAADFEKKFAEVLSLLDSPSPELIDQLKAGARDVAETFGQDVVNATDAMYQAISAGIPAAEAIDFIRSAATAAVGGVTDLKTAVDLGTNVLNAYGMEASQLNEVLDSTFIAVKLGKTTFEEMGGAIGRVAPLASNLGIGIDELNGALATITLSGIKTDEAVTGLKAALAGIMKPTSDSAMMAERLGIQFDNAAVKSKGLKTVLDEVAAAAAANGISLIDAFSALFGSTEAANAVLALYAQNGEKFTMVMDAMAEKTGAAAKAFGVLKENDPTFTFNQLSESVQGFSDRIGSAVLEMTGPLIAQVLEIVRAINSWIDANPKLAAAIAYVGAAIAAISLALAGAAAALVVIAGLVASIATITLPWLAAGVLVILPFLALFAGAAALIVANWDAIKAWVQTNWPAIKSTIVAAIGPIVDAAKEAGAAVRDQLQGAAGSFFAWLTENLPAIRAAVLGVATFIADTVIPAVGKAIQWVAGIVAWLAEYMVGVWPEASKTFGAAWDVLKELFKLIGNVLGIVWDFLARIIGIFTDGSSDSAVSWAERFHTALRFVLGVFETILKVANAVVGAVRDIVDFMGKIFTYPLEKLADLLGGGGKTPSVEDGGIPKFARGGVVTGPTLALAGEAGPEAFVPLDSGAIPVRIESIPGISGSAAAGAGYSPTVNIYQQPGESAESLAQRIAAVVMSRRA